MIVSTRVCGTLPLMTSETSSHMRKGPRHEGLKAWVACHELVLSVYRVSSAWPAAERYGLTSQARRAAYSTAANIAEGSAKRGNREFRRFMDIALGSISELTYILLLARDLGYLRPEVWGEIEAMRDHAGRLTWGLYRAINGQAVAPKANVGSEAGR
ncbi:MAG: four helix bundle protein [Gemmatimonadales bacterium]|nr:four helix bundle protein [Gemmatimonadales bacterium]